MKKPLMHGRSLRCALILSLCCCLLLGPGCGRQQRGRQAASGFALHSQLFDPEAASRTLASAFGNADTIHAPDNVDAAMRFVYARAGYTPLWVAADGLTDDARLLLNDLDSLRGDALNPEQFGRASLRRSFEALQQGGSPERAISFDTACTRAYLQASRVLLFGRITPRHADSLWFHANDSAWSAPSMLVAMASGKGYASLDSFRSRIPLYAALQAAYRRWRQLSADPAFASIDLSQIPDSGIVALAQRLLPAFEPDEADSLTVAAQARKALLTFAGSSSHAKKTSTRPIVADSVVARIAANMERLRWLPRQWEEPCIIVNVPQMMLRLLDTGGVALEMRVVVGRPSRQTPALNAELSSIILSPSWGVPPTIMKKDVLPGLSKSGTRYLRRKGLRVFDRKGRPVDLDRINEQNYRKFVVRQPPGERNALGEIKFNLPNRWDIYLHDTPHRSDFELSYRAKSSGCIRLQHPHELAGLLLRELEGRERLTPGRIDSIISTRKTRSLSMRHHIPVHIVYVTAAQNDGHGGIRLLPDIYHRDERLMKLLAARPDSRAL